MSKEEDDPKFDKFLEGIFEPDELELLKSVVRSKGKLEDYSNDKH